MTAMVPAEPVHTVKDPIYRQSPGDWKKSGRMKKEDLREGYESDKLKFSQKLLELYPEVHKSLEPLIIDDYVFIMKVLRSLIDAYMFTEKTKMEDEFKARQKAFDERMGAEG